jgi:hypothetical protein
MHTHTRTDGGEDRPLQQRPWRWNKHNFVLYLSIFTGADPSWLDIAVGFTFTL